MWVKAYWTLGKQSDLCSGHVLRAFSGQGDCTWPTKAPRRSKLGNFGFWLIFSLPIFSLPESTEGPLGVRGGRGSSPAFQVHRTSQIHRFRSWGYCSMDKQAGPVQVCNTKWQGYVLRSLSLWEQAVLCRVNILLLSDTHQYLKT